MMPHDDATRLRALYADLDLLPNGERFAFWDCATAFDATLHVNAAHPAAGDDQPGTDDAPLRSIGAAAARATPGTRVLIHAGVYRECVRPARGGTGPDAMISYESAGEGEVVITGEETWDGPWGPSQGWTRKRAPVAHEPDAAVWCGRLPRGAFDGYNPFGMVNEPSTYFAREKDADDAAYLQRRGLLYVDGVPLKQVSHPWFLWSEAGTCWVEDDGLGLHFRLPHDGDPREHAITFTAREQAFAPEAAGLGYIRVKGLCLRGVGNGFPAPQRGALSTSCGHHWIIEDCVVEWVNSVGIDLASQSPFRDLDEAFLLGHHIVRRNRVTDCGICGICGLPDGQRGLPSVLLEDNRIERCAWHEVESLYETGGIKLHLTRDCLVRRNLILDVKYGPFLWLDWRNVNTRACANVMLGCQKTMVGALFVEASLAPNCVDHNVVIGVGADGRRGHGGGHGLFAQETDFLTVAWNFVADTGGGAIFLNRGWVQRTITIRSASGRRNHVLGNVITGARRAIWLANADNTSDGNVIGACEEPGSLCIEDPEERLDLAAWRTFFGFDRHGAAATIAHALDRDALQLRVEVTRDGDDQAVATVIDLGAFDGLHELMSALHGGCPIAPAT